MDCSWVWSEVGKEALRLLEELRTEFLGKIFPILYKHMNVSQKNEDVLPLSVSLPLTTQENVTPPTSPSSDFCWFPGHFESRS